MIVLSNSTPFAEGGNRKCYVHPNNPDRCLKVVHPGLLEKIIKNKGILKYGNSSLEALQITPGDMVGFKPMREFEFIVDNELLYCMESNDIVIKYEHKANQKEYNPSWAKSS